MPRRDCWVAGLCLDLIICGRARQSRRSEEPETISSARGWCRSSSAACGRVSKGLWLSVPVYGLHVNTPRYFDVATNVAVSRCGKTASARNYLASERGYQERVVSRLGFEPRTQGLKVSVEAVHGVVPRRSRSTLRVVAVHRLHHVGPSTTAVAGSVAGSPSPAQTPIDSATRSQEWSSTPSRRRRYVVVTARLEWSRNELTASTDINAVLMMTSMGI